MVIADIHNPTERYKALLEWTTFNQGECYYGSRQWVINHRRLMGTAWSRKIDSLVMTLTKPTENARQEVKKQKII